MNPSQYKILEMGYDPWFGEDKNIDFLQLGNPLVLSRRIYRRVEKRYRGFQHPRLGMKVMEEEVAQGLGHWGTQSHYRHGTQKGYVVFGGRKLLISWLRMRTVRGQEASQ
jgi:hypothetical protein